MHVATQMRAGVRCSASSAASFSGRTAEASASGRLGGLQPRRLGFARAEDGTLSTPTGRGRAGRLTVKAVTGGMSSSEGHRDDEENVLESGWSCPWPMAPTQEERERMRHQQEVGSTGRPHGHGGPLPSGELRNDDNDDNHLPAGIDLPYQALANNRVETYPAEAVNVRHAHVQDADAWKGEALKDLLQFWEENRSVLGDMLPSREYLSDAGRTDLARMIRRLGGPAVVAFKLGLTWSGGEGEVKDSARQIERKARIISERPGLASLVSDAVSNPTGSTGPAARGRGGARPGLGQPDGTTGQVVPWHTAVDGGFPRPGSDKGLGGAAASRTPFSPDEILRRSAGGLTGEPGYPHRTPAPPPPTTPPRPGQPTGEGLTDAWGPPPLPEVPLPPLSSFTEPVDATRVLAAIQLGLEKGMVFIVEHSTVVDSSNHFWTPWRSLSRTSADGEEVLEEAGLCHEQFPHSFVRVVGYDAGKQTPGASSMLYTPNSPHLGPRREVFLGESYTAVELGGGQQRGRKAGPAATPALPTSQLHSPAAFSGPWLQRYDPTRRAADGSLSPVLPLLVGPALLPGAGHRPAGAGDDELEASVRPGGSRGKEGGEDARSAPGSRRARARVAMRAGGGGGGRRRRAASAGAEARGVRDEKKQGGAVRSPQGPRGGRGPVWIDRDS